MPYSSREIKSTSLLFRDRTPVCLVSVEHFVCPQEQGVFVEFRNEDNESPLRFRYRAKFEDWEVKELMTKLRDLLQYDLPLTFSDFQGLVHLEIPVTEVLASVYPIKLKLLGSMCTPERVEGVLYDRFGGSLIMEKFTTNRESLSRLLELLKFVF